MNETSSADSYEVASERLERAMARLEAGVVTLGDRAHAIADLRSEVGKLSAHRTKLASELDRATARANTLDESSADVSRRLIDAMETVKSVLAK